MMMFLPSIVMFHKNPSSHDLETKIFDLGKKKNVLPNSAFSVAYGIFGKHLSHRKCRSPIKISKPQK
jgi:hypothetical protein